MGATTTEKWVRQVPGSYARGAQTIVRESGSGRPGAPSAVWVAREGTRELGRTATLAAAKRGCATGQWPGGGGPAPDFVGPPEPTPPYVRALSAEEQWADACAPEPLDVIRERWKLARVAARRRRRRVLWHLDRYAFGAALSGGVALVVALALVALAVCV